MLNLDILITLRCNVTCKNCIELCNRSHDTGLDYSDSDMTLGQIDNFSAQLKAYGHELVFDNVYVSGGEPLLHPQFEQIFRRMIPLRDAGYFHHLFINSNLMLHAPEALNEYVVNFSKVDEKPFIHNAVLIHPKDFGANPRPRARCQHYRKDTWVLTYHGLSLCCAGDAYARLFCKEHVFMDRLPKSADQFPNMDDVCLVCPFGASKQPPLERDVGCVVSDIYRKEAEKNRNGRTIAKRFPERVSKMPDAPKVAWVCCTFHRPEGLGHLIHCFLQQDYPKELRRLVILDDAGQYENQSGDGWEIVSIPRRFMTLGQKRNAAIALLDRDTDIVCSVDDDDLYLPHAMTACVAAMKQGDGRANWAIPSAVYQENAPGKFSREPYHGHSSTWAFRMTDYLRTTGYLFENSGEDGGLQEQMRRDGLHVVDPLSLGFEPYCLYGRFQPFHAHTFKPGDYERLGNGCNSQKQELDIKPGYIRLGDTIVAIR
jgi:hypothetical protein